jgi:hypothetical protein
MTRIVSPHRRSIRRVAALCEPEVVPRVPGVAEAATNNAAWCDAVARTHGVTGSFSPDAWTAPTRTPPLHPDAVTLRPDVDARALLDRIDTGPGASVKDSFTTLDLDPYGFSVLFDATWIVRMPGTGALVGETETLTVVERATFAAWESAWRGDGPEDVVRPDVLDDPALTMLRSDTTAITAGAVLYANNDVIGLTNVFAPSDALDAAWRGIVAWASTHHPEAPLVGYESGPELATARRLGFEPIAPLRVWTRDA